MRSILILLGIILLAISANGQPVNKYIKEKHVTKIINEGQIRTIAS